MENSTITFTDFELNLKSLFEKKNLRSVNNHNPKLLKELDLLFNNLPVAANIFDHKKLIYTYCNENLVSLMGYTREQFMGEKGMKVVYDTFHPTHMAIYNAYLYPKVVEVMEEAIANNEDVKNYKFSSTFRAIRSNSQEFWCQVQFGVIETDSDGLPMYTLSLLNDVSHIKKDNNIDFLIYKTISGEIQQTISYTSFNEDNTQLKLSKREIEILRLVKNGNTTKEISSQLFVSENTVYTHRKNMLNKTNSKNMAELIQFASLKNIF
jgi:DNA-binding CsgD family transcriptional regulator